MHTILKGKTKEISIGIDRPFVMIGEKINPTGRKKLAAALAEGNLDFVRQLAENQIAWGAEVLDINVGVPGIDEIAVVRQVVELVVSLTDVPLCLDSANPDVLAAGLAIAPGKPLVNSVSGEEKKMAAVLPLVKERGAAVIGLTMDDNGIPKTAEERVAVAEKILERAAKLGIPAEDVIIDPLVLTVGSDSKAALITLQTVDLLRKEFGVNINLGASNVSFGLPERPTVNAAFLTLAIQLGATCSITDPIKLGQTVKAADLLLGRDDNSMRYLKYFRAAEALRAKEAEQGSSMEPNWNSRKVVVVGAGAVGSTFAYALAQKSLAEEIVLIDANREFAEGQALDLAHGLPYYPSVQIRAGQKHDYADAQVIVITAGAKQGPGESRLALLQKNAAIIESIVDEITGEGSQAVILVATNPVDILTYVALKRSGWLKGRVIGSGTVLDSSRFRYLLSQHCGVDVGNVHAYFLGEHGDSEFPAWSMTHIAGVSIDDFCPMCNKCKNWKSEREMIVKEVKESAYHIINYKGATYFAIGMALVRIVGTILQDQRSVLPVSTLLESEYGIEDVCLGVPCVVGQGGVRQIVEAPLSPEEKAALLNSASILQKALKELTG